MSPRATLITALLAIQLGIVGVAVVAVSGGHSMPSALQRIDGPALAGSRLIEGGPAQRLAAGAHPVLTVDIGNADLTVVARKTEHVEVSLSPSTAFGPFRSTTPIAASEDGDAVRIATIHRRQWSMGDDRMVTVVVPPETEVTVVDAGDIKATGLRAAASFNSIGSGSVTVEDYDAPALRVAARNGPISLRQVAAARIDASSRHDRIDGTGLNVRGGSIECHDTAALGFAPGTDTLVSARTDDGKVTLSGLSAAASTASGGRSGEDGDEDSSSQTVRVGTGSGRLDVRSRDGNIDLTQEN